MTKSITKEPIKALLITSYCCNDSEEGKPCHDENPCEECLRICNIVVIPKGTEYDVLGGMRYLHDERQRTDRTKRRGTSKLRVRKKGRER